MVQTCTAVSQVRLGGSGFLLQLEKPSTSPAWSTFEPGQIVGIQEAQDSLVRWYSIASAPHDKYIAILYTVVPEGMLTPSLALAEVGKPLWITLPRGSFTDPFNSLATIPPATTRPAKELNEPHRSQPGRQGQPEMQYLQTGIRQPTKEYQPTIWWIANGTGIAPFWSMVRHALADGEESARAYLSAHHLIYGCRTLEDWYGSEDFVLAQEHGLRCSVCLSQQEPSPTLPEYCMPRTRLTQWIQTWIGGAQLPGKAMLCGSSGMINDVRDILSTAGMDYARIISEIYY